MIELVNPNFLRGAIRCAVFDFDGTLSLLREGWHAIMATQMFEALRQTPACESAGELGPFIDDLIHATTGQQTIYQMKRLAEEVAQRGGQPATPATYKREFAERILARANARLAAIHAGENSAEAWLVPGARAWLATLHTQGIICYIASGTDEEFVRRESAALGIAPYFAGIFGAHDADPKNHSKKAIIARLVAQHALRPGELVTFGDGAPEIADTKAVGGIGVGVASNEDTRTGINARKRATLIAAGADVIVPDFSVGETLRAHLFAPAP